MVIVSIVLTLDIRLQNAGLMEELFKEEMRMWPHVALNVTHVINMDTDLVIVESRSILP